MRNSFADKINEMECFLPMGGFIREAVIESILEGYRAKVNNMPIFRQKSQISKFIENVAGAEAEIEKSLKDYNPKKETRELSEVLDKSLEIYIAEKFLCDNDASDEAANDNQIYID